MSGGDESLMQSMRNKAKPSDHSYEVYITRLARCLGKARSRVLLPPSLATVLLIAPSLVALKRWGPLTAARCQIS